jgi:ArsR family transcriptional regulator
MATMTIPTERTLGERCCVAPGDRRLPPQQAARLARDLRLLGDPVRLQILDLLASRPGEVCVCDLVANLPVRQPTISHHLRLLRRAGLVTVQRRGLWAHYTVVRPALDERRRRVREYFDNLTTTIPVSRARRVS